MIRQENRNKFLLIWGICLIFVGATRASKWVTNKDSIIVDANYADDEEGELHFDALDEPEKSECMTLDQEPGVCVTLRRCHPILFGDNGELRNPSLADEYSKSVDSCGTQNALDDEVGGMVHNQDDEEIVRSIPAEIGKASEPVADRVVCCAKDKVPHAHRSTLDDSNEELAMYPTTTLSPVVPFGSDVEQVTQVEELLIDFGSVAQSASVEPIIDIETTVRPVVFQEEIQGVEEETVTDIPVVNSSPVEASTFPAEPESPVTSVQPSSSTLPPPEVEEPQVAPIVPQESVDTEEFLRPSDSSYEACPTVTVYNTWPSFENYPFLAAIQTRANTGPLCSGSLIDNRHILTAAHCLHRFNSKDVARMQVRIGFTKNPSNDTYNDFHQERKASKIIFHKRFHEQSKMDNNIALVQLDQPVDFDDYVAPIGIFSGVRGFDVGDCAGVEAGWIKYGNRKVTGISDGVIHFVEPPMSDFVLREAISKIYKNDDCHSQLFTEITEDMLCAKTDVFEAHGVSTDRFRGNDGGPLVIKVGDRVQQVGIKSWAYEGNQYPTVFTRVDRYLDWIKDNLQM